VLCQTGQRNSKKQESDLPQRAMSLSHHFELLGILTAQFRHFTLSMISSV
jgi:hypothetical protein